MALIFAGVMNMGSYWFSDKIVIKMYKGEETTHGVLYDVVRDLCQRNNMVMPKVYVLPQSAPNAFATGRNPEHAVVAATSGLIDILSREELSGVMAHELSHVQHRDILIGSIAATVAGAISFMANMAQWSLIFGGRDDEDSNPVAMIAMMILAPIAAMLVQMAISRSREYLADEGGEALWQPTFSCQRPAKARSVQQPGSDAKSQRSDGAYVYSQSVTWWGNEGALFDPPADG